MGKKSFAYVVTGLLLIAAMIVTYVIQVTSEPEAASEPPPKPSRMYWADGAELDASTPQAGLIRRRAERELEADGVFHLDKRGYAIELTIDPKAQQLAERTVDEAREGQPGNLRAALVAVDPKTGRIVAYKAHQEEKQGFDFASAWANPGSAFMPFVLVAYLQKGHRLDETYDGTSGRKFGSAVVNNWPDGDCSAQCTVREAMQKSVNTVFAGIAFQQTGLQDVARAAVEAGIPANIGRDAMPLDGTPANPPDLSIALGGGKYVVRPLDMAGAYATFAADGIKRQPHIVAKVMDPAKGNVVIYDGDEAARVKSAFDRDRAKSAGIARTVTESLLPAGLPCAENRPCAGKPGIHGCVERPGKTAKTDSCSTWMVGYSPQISTAVWFGSDDNSALKDKTGAALTGKGLPGQTWQRFMDAYLTDKPVEQFPVS